MLLETMLENITRWVKDDARRLTLSAVRYFRENFAVATKVGLLGDRFGFGESSPKALGCAVYKSYLVPVNQVNVVTLPSSFHRLTSSIL